MPSRRPSQLVGGLKRGGFGWEEVGLPKPGLSSIGLKEFKDLLLFPLIGMFFFFPPKAYYVGLR